MKNLIKFLEGRRKAIEGNIAAEKLSGNVVKESFEKGAMAEVVALICELQSGRVKTVPLPGKSCCDEMFERALPVIDICKEALDRPLGFDNCRMIALQDAITNMEKPA
jgi:hypothetical protein